jgi:formate-dependent nitrite reductase membrane component NrfD
MDDLLLPVLIVVGAAFVGLGSIMVKHRLFPPEPEAEPKEGVGEYIAMMVGVLYALVLGIVLVSVWEARDDAQASVQTEASSLNQISLLAHDVPAPSGPLIQRDVQAYANIVVTVEWPEMAAHQPLSAQGWTSLNALTAAIEAYQPVTAVQQNISAELLSQLSSVDDARHSRQQESGDSLSAVLWIGLVLGGAISVVFVFCFGVRRSGEHVTMVMGLTGLVGFLVVMVFELNHPFSGSMGIDSGVFTQYLSAT